MTIADFQTLIGKKVIVSIQNMETRVTGKLEHLTGNVLQVGNMPFLAEQGFYISYPPHSTYGYIMIRKPKKHRTEKLRAHVACDYIDSNGIRQFTFTPLNAENKGIAAIQLNGEGEVIGARVTAPYIKSLQGLIRLARVYLKRSIPVKVI